MVIEIMFKTRFIYNLLCYENRVL